ncbi:TPA: hypothetical protein ID016_002800 [Escherichia coli]|nr:hypothetical protein [Escherichia coli]
MTNAKLPDALRLSGLRSSCCIQLLEGPYVETAPEVVAAFRPKSARREVSE